MSRVAAIQMNSGITVEKNLQTAAQLIAQAATEDAQLVVLPENFALMEQTPSSQTKSRETFGNGRIQDFLAQQAQQHKIWLVGGTIPLATQNPNKVPAACLVFNPQGVCVARYDKIHLFDVCITKGEEEYCESHTIEQGEQTTLIDTPLGKLGLAVCYDIRFPELFRKLFAQDAEILAIPSAFTVKAGLAHWELLARARAVENLCYVIGATQTGTHENGRKTFGHALIINPWGEILACLPENPGVITADIDLKKQQQIRKEFPVGEYRKIM